MKKTTYMRSSLLSIFAIFVIAISFVGCDGGITQSIHTTEIAAISGVVAPVTGAFPDLTITSTADYTGTVAWAPSSGAYAANTGYTATITLTAKSGSTLDGVEANFFTVAGATSASNATDSGVVTAVFPNTGSVIASQAPVQVKTAENYVILAKTLISTTGATAITGDLGMSPAATTYITGFGLVDFTGYAESSLVTGKVYAADMASPTSTNLTTAVEDMLLAYSDAAGRTLPNQLNLKDGAIGGMTLAPGLYAWGSAVGIGADLTLNGSSTDVWIFQISGNLSMVSMMNVLLVGGAKAENIFWQVAGIATLGAGAHMEGIILSENDIVLQTGSSVNGRLLSKTQVTLDAATVVQP